MSAKNKELCLSLLYAESEREVIKILVQAGYWNGPSAWHNFDDNESNWSQIGNQQGHPVAALVEKLVNSIDAVLMRECQLRGIPLEGAESPTPQSINEALESFFGIRHGNLVNIGSSRRSELAREIGFIATGPMGQSKRNPNYTVFDRGEGQTPRDMPDTLLSLSKSNKLRIPFVQGKFNMGGTGVLRHGGRHRLQLVISRRCPDIADPNDPTATSWGFTLVRRQDTTGSDARSSVFTYLAPFGHILVFKCDALRLPSSERYASRAPSIEWGTAIKLYEYKLKGLTTSVKFDPYYAISLKLPKPGLPVRFYEFRNYRQESPEETMAGLLVRLDDDRRRNIEEGFPNSYPIRVMGEPVKVDIYAFKRESADDRFRKSEGIIFTINGQSHGALSKRFFSRKKVKMDYLKDSILVIADASELSTFAREDLFMNSRDRLSEGELRDSIESELERIVRDDTLLRQLRERRRREELAHRISDNKPLHDVLEKIIHKSRALAAIFVSGKDLGNPFKSVPAAVSREPYVGKYFPTYFRLFKKHVGRNERPINRKRIQFQFDTDAANGYLTREADPCKFELLCNGQEVRDFVPNLLDGTVTLNISLPDNASVGDTLQFVVNVTDDTQIAPFENEFEVIITDEVSKSRGKRGERKPKVDDPDGDRTRPDRLDLPDPREVFQRDWDLHGFKRETALAVKESEEGYDYYINMDNIYLNTEIKSLNSGEDPKLMQSKFKYAMVLIGMMILKDTVHDLGDDAGENMTPTETVEKFTSMIAPVILPMIQTLGDLEHN